MATGNQIKVPGIWYIGAWASLVASPGVWEVQEHLLNTRWWPSYRLPNLFFLSQQCHLQGPTWLHLTLITSGKSHSQISLAWRFGGIIYSIRAWRAHSNHSTRNHPGETSKWWERNARMTNLINPRTWTRDCSSWHILCHLPWQWVSLLPELYLNWNELFSFCLSLSPSLFSFSLQVM